MGQLKKILAAVVLSLGAIALAETRPSIYDLQSKWLDIENKPVGVGVAKGHYVIVAMVYTGCAHACPMTISKVQEIEKALRKSGLKDLKMVMASFDVKNDRPQKLKAYQASRSLPSDSWKFLAPQSDADARELAVALGISYKDLGNGDFSHSNVISLLDRQGVVIASIDSLTAALDPFREAAKGAK